MIYYILLFILDAALVLALGKFFYRKKWYFFYPIWLIFFYFSVALIYELDYEQEGYSGFIALQFFLPVLGILYLIILIGYITENIKRAKGAKKKIEEKSKII